MSAARSGRLWVIGAVVLGLLLSAATYLLVVAPARSDAASVQSQVDDASLTQTTLRHRLRDLAAAAQDTAAIRAAGAAAATALPVSPDTQGLLRQVQAVATASRVVVGAVAIGEPEAADTPGVWAITVTVDLAGAPTDLVAVTAALQSGGGRALSIDSTSLQTGDGGATTLTLGITMYCSSDPAGGAAAGTGAAGTAPAASAPAAGAPAVSGAGAGTGTDAGAATTSN